MALSQRDINKAAVTAVLLVHDKSRAELETLRSELATPELRNIFAKSLLVALLPHLPSMSTETGAEYCEDITKRMHYTVNKRLESLRT